VFIKETCPGAVAAVPSSSLEEEEGKKEIKGKIHLNLLIPRKCRPQKGLSRKVQARLAVGMWYPPQGVKISILVPKR
jgi:hypothetical protein